MPVILNRPLLGIPQHRGVPGDFRQAENRLACFIAEMTTETLIQYLPFSIYQNIL